MPTSNLRPVWWTTPIQPAGQWPPCIQAQAGRAEQAVAITEQAVAIKEQAVAIIDQAVAIIEPAGAITEHAVAIT